MSRARFLARSSRLHCARRGACTSALAGHDKFLLPLALLMALSFAHIFGLSLRELSNTVSSLHCVERSHPMANSLSETLY